ncbi:CO(2)-response secreted protease-like isoform X2 [Andrographis paniculata]|nr:CO(2)-response secreted protease-like isoform X2 [Andrographis paniculata]
MGASHGYPRDNHAQLLTSLLTRKKNPVVRSYGNGFAGFAAHLSEKEAKAIAGGPGVVSVFPDKDLQLHTTRSWEFLKYQSGHSTATTCPAGADTVIGFLDTGIWPESKSFSDVDLGPIPAKWRGKCMQGRNFTSSSCNRKLIGARYYDSSDGSYTMGTPRDEDGHGTHIAATAAGMPVSGANYYGLAKGVAKGGSPSSRIAMYRVCRPNGGCPASAILQAFDDAIGDGVDVLAVPLGAAGEQSFSSDPVAIGALHAAEKGIVVVSSAGNFGPSAFTVQNFAPWIFTAAATTTDRRFETSIILGDNKVVKGGGINFSSLNKSPIYHLIDGTSIAKSNSSQRAVEDAGDCNPGSLDDSKVRGKIVVCRNVLSDYQPKDKYDELKKQGAVGMITIDDQEKYIPSKFGTSPVTGVSLEDGDKLLSYIKSNRNPQATILPTATIFHYKPAPEVGYFSSRGPGFGISELLKPDIAAPGEAILAAWPSNDRAEAVFGQKPPHFDMLTGTSMACAHVAGLAAVVKSHHPNWSPSAIKSAIMTSATQTNNVDAPITTHAGSIANPYDIGAGVISLSGPLHPGLVFETSTFDYFQFLCNTGMDTDQARRISQTNFTCKASMDMNYPSIAVAGVMQNQSKAVSRTVTNVGEINSTYIAIVDAPAAVKIEVVPKKLQFTDKIRKLKFRVKFRAAVGTESREDFFGSITWSDKKYKVRIPVVAATA